MLFDWDDEMYEVLKLPGRQSKDCDSVKICNLSAIFLTLADSLHGKLTLEKSNPYQSPNIL